MKLNHNKAFVISGVKFVPYRHHASKIKWLVKTIDDEEVFDFSCAANSGEEAAIAASRSYKRYLEEQEKLERIKELEDEDKAKKETVLAQEMNTLNKKSKNDNMTAISDLPQGLALRLWERGDE